jgi:hypothetical protein
LFNTINAYAQSFLSSSASIYSVNYNNTKDFNYNNISKSLALAYQIDLENTKLSFYLGLRYYRETTNKNCVSFTKDGDRDIPSFFLDDINCEYNHFKRIQNLGFQMASGYKVFNYKSITFSIFAENNIILYERNQNVFDTTPNSPNTITRLPFGEYFKSWLEPYIFPTLSYVNGSLFANLGLSYGIQDLNFDKILFGLRMRFGINI